MNPQYSGPPPAYTGYPGYSAPPPVLAPFGERLAAYLIDALILGAAAMIYTIPLTIYVTMQAFALTGPNGTTNEEAVPAYLASLFISMGVAFVLGLAISYLYHVEFVLRSGQTLGKRFMKLYIVRLGQSPGHGISRGDAVKRWGATIGLGFVPGGSYLDGLWQLWDKPYQQCLHDKAASTTVVKVSPVSSTPMPGGVFQ
ncbi:putative RDD family membrane protein YckC [Catenuloplanes nepalensis]|uniref:RDD family membrane protein YckC n=1 Tax=Catenuloplanes nepalensis TaxID=587533 RepID=A0ABT9N3B5_9ACTN|nr:RDD family protein [Catenuloplanes nepalensis]MDP9798193.1 putative RDD family membrane protein YckC [Catenuloplanes nepalensis]